MTNPNPTTCEALIVHCIDFRLQKFLHAWSAERFGYDNFDILAIAGAARDYETIFKHVQLAAQVHNIQTVCVVNHEDCRGYGAEGTRERHSRDLNEARKKINAAFSHLNVETYYLHLDGTFELILP
ncbi:MAG: hypothetical protein LC099_10940 [Anaerolineales bacterium]|nr:hypothetical protein [Anaerolineales bacterium]